jgi:hypothetical protein
VARKLLREVAAALGAEGHGPRGIRRHFQTISRDVAAS